MIFVCCVIGALCVAVEAVIHIDAAARRGERVYLARHRDHSKVPLMRWKDSA